MNREVLPEVGVSSAAGTSCALVAACGPKLLVCVAMICHYTKILTGCGTAECRKGSPAAAMYTEPTVSTL